MATLSTLAMVPPSVWNARTTSSDSVISLRKDSLLVAGSRLWIRYAPTLLFKERLWRFVHWRSHRYEVRTRAGFVMRGVSNDLVQGYLYYFGVWEPNLTAWLSRRFGEMGEAIFLDIGANVGYYTLLAHSLMPADASVIAIEASPLIHRALSDNIDRNGFDRIRTVNCAAADKHGQLTLYHGDERNLGGSTTMAGVWDDRGTIVEARPLIDILSPDEVSRVRLIKIDVEGAELAVLGGLWPILDKFPREVEIVVEISARDATEVFDLFEAAGFRAYGLTNHYSYKCYLSPAPIAVPVRLQQRPTLGGDFIFSRRDLAFL